MKQHGVIRWKKLLNIAVSFFLITMECTSFKRKEEAAGFFGGGGVAALLTRLLLCC